MLIQRIDDLPVEPWKNGGGVTRTVASDDQHVPPHWRLSVANIHTSGPFSSFEGIDRISILLEGQGLRLQCGADTRLYQAVGDSYAYPGEEPTEAQLGDVACRFLNVMVRRDACLAQVECDTEQMNLGQYLVVLVVPLCGSIQLPLLNAVVAAGEYLLLTPDVQALSIAPHQPSASWVVVAIFPKEP